MAMILTRLAVCVAAFVVEAATVRDGSIDGCAQDHARYHDWQ
jgi:hypothetical protein